MHLSTMARWATAVVAFGSTAATAVDVHRFADNPERYSRFTKTDDGRLIPTTSDEFMMAGVDLSGIGWRGNINANANRAGRAVTLITPRHIVFAAHWPAGPGSLVQFMAPDGDIVSRHVESMKVLQTPDGWPSDLAIGTLDERLGDEITPIPVGHPTDMNYIDQELCIYGKLGRFGTNSLPSYWDDDWTIGFWDETRFTQDTAPGTAISETGDSGSPTLVRVGDQLLLVGVRWVETGDTWVPAYAEALADLAAADGETVQIGLPQDPPPTCPADMNGDRLLNGEDVSQFISAFSAGADAADIASPSGVPDGADVSAFITGFQSGCE